MRQKILYFFIFICSFSSVVFAQQVYVINPDHSQIQFEIDYLKISSVKGHFQEFAGEVVLDNQLVAQKAQVVIQSDSITTYEPKRDAHLKKRDFLAVGNHPTISFVSQAPAKMQGQHGQITGVLNFLGKKHPIDLKLELLGPQVDPWGKRHVFYNISTTLNRKDLGIEWNKLLDQGGLLVGEKVQVKGTLQLQPKGDKTPFSTHMIPGPPSGGKKRKVLPKKSLEKIKEDYSKNEKKETDDQTKTFSHPQKRTHQVSFWQWFQVGVLSFFALFGAICMGVGLKYLAEKNMPHGRFQHLAEIIFILIVFALSTCLYTLMRLLLASS